MFTHFLNILATVISVVSLLIVTYGALVAFIFSGKRTQAIYRTIFNSQYPSAASGIRYLFIIGIGVADRFRYS